MRRLGHPELAGLRRRDQRGLETSHADRTRNASQGWPLRGETAFFAKSRRKYKATTDSNHALPVPPNLLEQRFDAERRTNQGLSKPEILRCLKRYIAREVFKILRGLNRTEHKRVFATLKKELVRDHAFETRALAHSEVFEYIEVFYNRRRAHSLLDYETPTSFEACTRTSNIALFAQ